MFLHQIFLTKKDTVEKGESECQNSVWSDANVEEEARGLLLGYASEERGLGVKGVLLVVVVGRQGGRDKKESKEENVSRWIEERGKLSV